MSNKYFKVLALAACVVGMSFGNTESYATVPDGCWDCRKEFEKDYCTCIQRDINADFNDMWLCLLGAEATYAECKDENDCPFLNRHPIKPSCAEYDWRLGSGVRVQTDNSKKD